MTWIKGLRPNAAIILVLDQPAIRIYDLNKGITTYKNVKSYRDYVRKLEFMTWIKGLRLAVILLNTPDRFKIRIYDLNKGITTAFKSDNVIFFINN